MASKETIILGIETSCDDTSAAILKNYSVLSNVTANQLIHERYGGVVPELASRSHQENIVHVVNSAISKANVELKDIDAIAFTQGPGLLGSLLVGASFAKSFALARKIPLIAVHHMKAHILAHFIDDAGNKKPEFPFLCLTVSGGHTQIVKVSSAFEMEIIGKTIDDAAGEAFDKAAKMFGLSYPGGPLIDKFAKIGNPKAFRFSKPKIDGLDFSFSGLKTSILYFLNAESKKNPRFIEDNLSDLCSSVQQTIIEILIEKLKSASIQTGIRQIAISGGVSANSGLRMALKDLEKDGFETFIPKFEYCTDNAAMIAVNGKFLFDDKMFVVQSVSAQARLNW
ncbi:MAG: tRNA (adenosine(37)-N6)-threonylcarbamoyltransferase complex transferase subunit TsaD [Crocinitomicaceae bacterium]